MFPQLVIAGLAHGSIYALVALGLVVVFKGSRAVNFAHGEVFALAAFVSYLLIVSGSLGYIASLVLAVAFTVAVGVVVERVAYRPLIRASDLALIIASIAVSFAIKGLLRVWFGARGEFVSMPPIFSFEPIIFGGLFIPPQQLIVVGSGALCLAAFWVFFRFTRIGRMMQAVAEDRDAAAIVGIDASRVFLWIWALGALLGGIAGVLMAPVTLVYPDMGFPILIKAFAAAMLGGFDSLLGAVIGGILVGVIEQLVGGYVGTLYQEISAFVLIVVVLLLRPSGLLGSRQLTRV
jgi:branched-chain amino acid transport system permease protein